MDMQSRLKAVVLGALSAAASIRAFEMWAKAQQSNALLAILDDKLLLYMDTL